MKQALNGLLNRMCNVVRKVGRTERRSCHEEAEQRGGEDRHKARQVAGQHECQQRRHERDHARHQLNQHRMEHAGPHAVQQQACSPPKTFQIREHKFYNEKLTQ